ncbi:mannose/glucose-specific lectin [Eucalyptus grandis]|uniref:mannose/glucose-specific lectin n=1 Tax=Eucalyptus grandis TaxID=71139 RepID=UPI00192EA3D5|nr:mannose/glucose-specific lectin [Eucalyptus grandis]
MPFGTAKGRYFSFPYSGGKIIGFHGRCDGPRLESIGAYYEPIPHTYPIKVFGPFGGAGGDSWDDGQYVHISRIAVRYGTVIDSIAFDYIDTNGSKRSIRHGGNSGENICEVKLAYPDEYITSFSGYINSNNSHGLINSLTFRTNKRIWGPIGKEEGKYFSLPSEAGKLVGFFGRSGTLLDSIGAHIELFSNKLYPFKSVGLFGGSGGSSWDDGNHHANVRKIIIVFEPSREPIIESITFQYEEEDGDLRLCERHGGTDQGEIHVIDLYDSDEYLTSISGYIRSSSSCPTVIRSLTFQSNKRTIGPVGDEKGVYFSSPTTGGKIIGFYGRSGDHLDAIGVYFEPISHLYPIKSIGPFGGLGGNAWDDGKFSGVREIEIMHDDMIHYIFFCYDKNGEPVCSYRRGAGTRNGKAKVTKVRLDYPREYLTSISGYKRETDKPIVDSLTFYSNKGRYGPFGKEIGRYFGYPSTGSKIIGFYGRSGSNLDSIGVYAEPISHLYPFKSLGPFGGEGGDPWDDGVHTDVRGFDIVVGSVIDSIRVEYDYNGSSVQCSKHGGDSGDRHEVKLDYPKERLISISGYIRESGGSPPTVIQSLKIHTTRGIYGPFGKAKGKKFCIPSDAIGGRIIGFYGRSGSHLDSIGARLEPYS